MLTQLIFFLGTDTGKQFARWALGVGMPLVILSIWVLSLKNRQETLETKVDNLNTEVKQTLRFQTDTMYKTLDRTNRILERLDNSLQYDKSRSNQKPSRGFF